MFSRIVMLRHTILYQARANVEKHVYVMKKYLFYKNMWGFIVFAQFRHNTIGLLVVETVSPPPPSPNCSKDRKSPAWPIWMHIERHKPCRCEAAYTDHLEMLKPFYPIAVF